MFRGQPRETLDPGVPSSPAAASSGSPSSPSTTPPDVDQMWAAAMMLDHLGEPGAAKALLDSFESALASGVRTRDLGGTAGTAQFTAAALDHTKLVTTSTAGSPARAARPADAPG
jgi:hypothetical protein